MKTNSMLLCAAALAGALFAVPACSDDHDHDDHTHDATTDGGHSSPYPACNAIIAACHMVDVGEGAIHDCHDQAHGAASDADCLPKKDQCVALCEAAAADGGMHDDDAGDAAAQDQDGG